MRQPRPAARLLLKEAFLDAKREAANLRKKKKPRRIVQLVETKASAPQRPQNLTRGQLYAYHKQAGTLGIYYLMYPEEAPAA